MQTVDGAADMATVSAEVAKAYADCWDYHPDGERWSASWEGVSKRRNLDFLATKWLARDDAKWVMQQWVRAYNDFHSDLLDNLPRKAMLRIARESSVAIYVKGADRLPGIAKMSANEKRPVFLLGVECVRYWWD